MAFSVPQVGDVFEERYQLVSRLGAGSYALVFKAEQLKVGRTVAVKILLPADKGFDDSTLTRFQREAKLLAQLRHPNTLILHDFGWTQAEHPFLVTEFVPGHTLKEEMVANGAMEPRRAIAVLRQVMGSLNEAHALGVIHRDVKPANIMLFDRVDEVDVVKVLDFGIAKFIDSVTDEDAIIVQDLTARDRLMGTPRYMAPEQLAKRQLSPATDLYALGLVFYEMLTDSHAVGGRTSAVVIARQLDDKPVIARNDPAVPPALRGFFQKCTAKYQGDRFQSVQEALEYLDEHVSEDVDLSAKPKEGLFDKAVKTASSLTASSPKSSSPPAKASANPSALAGLPAPASPDASAEPLALSTGDIMVGEIDWDAPLSGDLLADLPDIPDNLPPPHPNMVTAELDVERLSELEKTDIAALKSSEAAPDAVASEGAGAAPFATGDNRWFSATEEFEKLQAEIDEDADPLDAPVAPWESQEPVTVAGGTPMWVYVAIAAAILCVIVGGLVYSSSGEDTVESEVVATVVDKPSVDKRAEDESPGVAEVPTKPEQGEGVDDGGSDPIAALGGGVADSKEDEPPQERQILVQTEPQGANVRIDTKVIGQTPLVVSAKSGAQMTVQLERRGYLSHDLTLGIESEEEVMIKLERKPTVAAPPLKERRRRRRTTEVDKKDGKSRFKGF